MRFEVIKGEPGEHILHCILRTIEKAKELSSTVVMDYNDTQVYVYPESYSHDISDKYFLLREDPF